MPTNQFHLTADNLRFEDCPFLFYTDDEHEVLLKLPTQNITPYARCNVVFLRIGNHRSNYDYALHSMYGDRDNLIASMIAYHEQEIEYRRRKIRELQDLTNGRQGNN